MISVGLVGFFGWGNYGDELMYSVWAKAFRGRARTQTVHTLLQRPYFQSTAEEVASQFDSLVVGGGDLVIPSSISSLYWNRAWLQLPVSVAGVGVALEGRPARPDVVRRMGAFFQHSSIQSVSARDEASARWISQNLIPNVSVDVSSDLGFAAALPEAEITGTPILGVVLRKTPEDVQLRFVERLQKFAQQRNMHVNILVAATGMERQTELTALAGKVPRGVEVRTADSVDEVTGMIGGCAAIFTAKFHAAVVAARYAIPTVSLRTTHKIKALALSIQDPVMATLAWDLDDAELDQAITRTVPLGPVHGAEQSAEQTVDRTVHAVLNR